MAARQTYSAKGEGYIFIYHFDEDFLDSEAFIPRGMRDCFDGGFGAVIFADFTESPIGSYRELFFIPGRFKVGGESRYVITKAYTSTQESMQANLFSRNELADFHIENVADGVRIISVTRGGKPIFSIQAESWGFELPVSTDMIHFPLMQVGDGGNIIWDYEGKGNSVFAKVNSIEVRPAKFPDVAQYSPLLGAHLEEFELTFSAEK